MKHLKIALFVFFMCVCASFVLADCIGNTTHSCQVLEAIVTPGGTTAGSNTWCCTPVGNGSDYSCTDGSSWELQSTLGCSISPI